MKNFKFQTQDLAGVMPESCRSGVETPAGSYAREVAEVDTLGAVDRLSAGELAQIGVVEILPAPFDAMVETIAAILVWSLIKPEPRRLAQPQSCVGRMPLRAPTV